MPAKIEYMNIEPDGEVTHVRVSLAVPNAEFDLEKIFHVGFAIVAQPSGGPIPAAQSVEDLSAMEAQVNAEVNAAAEPHKRVRRTRAQIEADEAAKQSPNAPVSEPGVPDTGSTEATSRRRRAPAAAPDPMPITDAELSKAASSAAAELVQLGDDGPALVMLVLQDFQVTTVGDLVGPNREKFIHELRKEVEAAKAEKAA